MLRKLFAMGLSLTLAVSLMACSQQAAPSEDMSSDAATEAQTSDSDSLKIGIASREIVGDVNRDIIAGAQEYLESMGAEVVVTDGQSDPQKHNENIESLINSGIDGLIIQYGDAEQLQPLIAKANEKGIPVATGMIGTTVEGAVTDVGGDEETMVRLMGEELLKSVDYKGDIYVVSVPGAPLLEARKKMFEDMAAEYPEVTLHDIPAEHNTAKVQTQIEELMTANPEVGSIAGIWSAYDLLCSGASEAIRRAGRDEIQMASIDGDRIGFQMIMTEGSPFIATVAMDMRMIGQLEAEAVMGAINGDTDIPESSYTSCWLVTRDNCVEAVEMRYGEGFWEEVGIAKADVEALYPQTGTVDVIQRTE